MKHRKRKHRACETKQKFKTLQEARAAAHWLARRAEKKGNPIASYVNAYGCECGSFHIGKSRDINWNVVR